MPERTLPREAELGHRARTSGPTDAAWRLVCLPHAGGSAGAYARWGVSAAVLDRPRTVALQYPGHETRVREQPIETFDALVAEFTEPLGRLVEDGTPTVLLGHSLGASVAVALSRVVPVDLLVLSGRAAPRLRMRTPQRAPLDDEGWRRWLRRLGGTPEELLRDSDALTLAVRCLRADLAAAADLEQRGDCAQAERAPLRTPALLTVAARDDPAVPPDAVATWSQQLPTGSVDHGTVLLDGGHFALLGQPTAVVAAVATALGRDL